MKKLLWFIFLLVSLVPALPVSAEPALPPLIFREAKLKGEDFIVLQATTDDVKLDKYWLGYDSSATLENIDPEYRLATATLQSGDAIMLVNDDAVPTCDALYSMDMPFDLAESKGTIGLWHRDPSTSSANIHYTRIDSFSWTTTATGKADIVRPEVTEKDYVSASPLILPVWFRDLSSSPLTWNVGGLQFDAAGACIIKTTAGKQIGYVSDDAAMPPVIDEAPTEEGNENAVDLAYPMITELLPNPAGTGNDASDEFIELYNPNDSPFLLDGYALQTGVSTLHTYEFPDGTSLAPGYSTFYAEETALSMSNTSGQARLLDPSGRTIAETAAYDGADDGMAWGYIDGSWQWTASPTPGASNVLVLAQKTITKTAVKAAMTTKKTTTKTASVKKASTTKAKTTSAQTKSVASEATKPPRGIHPLVLVGILLTAVGYGVYEHRQDMANALYQYRSNRATRRSNRR